MDRPQLRLIRVREQSAATSSQWHQVREQTVRSRDTDTASTGCQAAASTDANGPQTGRNPELSTSAASFLTNIGCEREPAKHCPDGRIVVAISPPTHFPVYILRI